MIASLNRDELLISFLSYGKWSSVPCIKYLTNHAYCLALCHYTSRSKARKAFNKKTNILSTFTSSKSVDLHWLHMIPIGRRKYIHLSSDHKVFSLQISDLHSWKGCISLCTYSLIEDPVFRHGAESAENLFDTNGSHIWHYQQTGRISGLICVGCCVLCWCGY